MRYRTWGIVAILLALAGTARARQTAAQPDDAVAAAARRAREQKKEQSKPKVWDNDNIPRSPGELSVVGPPASQATTPADSAMPAAADSSKPDAATPKASSPIEKKASIQSELLAAKDALQTLQNDIDIMQRKLVLDQQTYYSKPGYSSDKAGAAALDDEQAQIDAKEQEMQADQSKIADLQAQLDALSDTKPPQPPAQQ